MSTSRLTRDTSRWLALTSPPLLTIAPLAYLPLEASLFLLEFVVDFPPPFSLPLGSPQIVRQLDDDFGLSFELVEELVLEGCRGDRGRDANRSYNVSRLSTRNCSRTTH